MIILSIEAAFYFKNGLDLWHESFLTKYFLLIETHFSNFVYCETTTKDVESYKFWNAMKPKPIEIFKYFNCVSFAFLWPHPHLNFYVFPVINILKQQRNKF